MLGSVPAAVWTGRLFFKKDVREHGSGNAGATNTFRVLGKPAGTFVLLFDAGKGYLAAALADQLFLRSIIGAESLTTFRILLGLAAVLGHIYPVFAGFRGGKGVATLLGMVLCVHPQAALSSVGVFLLVFLSTGYVSLGSLLAASAFPLVLLTVFKAPNQEVLIAFGACMFVWLVFTHRANIKRLREGKENRFKIWSR